MSYQDWSQGGSEGVRKRVRKGVEKRLTTYTSVVPEGAGRGFCSMLWGSCGAGAPWESTPKRGLPNPTQPRQGGGCGGGCSRPLGSKLEVKARGQVHCGWGGGLVSGEDGTQTRGNRFPAQCPPKSLSLKKRGRGGGGHTLSESTVVWVKEGTPPTHLPVPHGPVWGGGLVGGGDDAAAVVHPHPLDRQHRPLRDQVAVQLER